ncbi:hypothetical protein [Erwinia sp. SLM-02]|uniref:hypothetical protein n=1 Tax=Erwinia sp. SLM-02 TaxID=3020057 RepID=UPI0030800C22
MKKLIDMFTRERLLQLADENTICRLSLQERIALANLALMLNGPSEIIYQIRKNDGSPEWEQWLEVCADEFYANIKSAGWEYRKLYVLR